MALSQIHSQTFIWQTLNKVYLDINGHYSKGAKIASITYYRETLPCIDLITPSINDIFHFHMQFLLRCEINFFNISFKATFEIRAHIFFFKIPSHAQNGSKFVRKIETLN